jgi:hypothetical protein
MIGTHNGHAAIYFGRRVYVFGGVNTDVCEFYDFEANAWTKIASLPERLQQCSGVVHKNRIYLKGSNSSTIYEFFPSR